MERIFYEGMSEEELMDKLEQLDSMTKIDSVIRSGERYKLEFEKRHGKINGWRIIGDTKAYQNSKPLNRGRHFNTFAEAMETLDEEKLFCMSSAAFSILCFGEMSSVKNWDGSVKSIWYKVNPFCPYEIVKGQPRFDTLELNLKQDEVRIMLETKIAFYDEKEDILYPIREVAMASLSRLLGLPPAFYKQAEHLLGAALVMAELLTKKLSLNILCRSKKNNIKPVIGIVTDKYKPYPQKKFISKCLGFLYENGIYDMDSWSISDELTRVNMLRMGSTIKYHTGVLIQTSDISGIAMSVTAYVKIHEQVVPLKTNAINHIVSSKDTDIKELFNGIFEELDRFEKEFELLSQTDIIFDTSLIRPIKKVIGKKRMKSIHYPAYQLS